MIITPYSFNSYSLQSTDFETSIPRSFAQAQQAANISYVKRTSAPPVYSGKELLPVTMTLEVLMKHDFMDLLETVNQIFDISDETPRQFICQDTSTSDNTQYYVYATPKSVLGGHDGNMATVVLSFTDPVWKSVTEHSQVMAITASGDSTSVTVSGNAESYPTLEITNSTTFSYNNFIQYIPSARGSANRHLEILGDTNGIGLDTAALVAANKATTDGSDFRVFVDGAEVDRWFGGLGWGTTDTKCWINIDQPAARTLKLKTAIASTDSSTSVEFVFTPGYKNIFESMPNQSQFVIDSEEFTYTSKRITANKLFALGVTRSVRNTTAASHSADASVSWIPYDICVSYGSSDATAPETDDTVKPILNLTSSLNSSLVFTNFSDDAKIRTGIWKQQVQKVTNPSLSTSTIYTGLNATDTDPASVAGMQINAYQSAGNWRPETSVMYWWNYFPEGVSTLTYSYERYQYGVSTPSVIALQTSPDGITYTNLKTYSTITTTDRQTWVTGTEASSDITIPSGTYYLRYIMAGTVTAVANNTVSFGAKTPTVGLTSPPTIVRRGEQSNMIIDGVFAVGENEIRISYPLQTGKTLIIDTDPNYPKVSINGVQSNGIAEINSVRNKWLPFSPGANTITYTTSRTVSMSVTIKWRDRMSFL